MVDRELVLRKIADLEVYGEQLRAYREVTPDEYRRDWRVQRIIERTLQIAIECCVDMASHVIADRRLRVPATYAETYEVLAEAGLLDTPRREAMVRMAGFRNVLVHGYARLDPAMVIGILRNHLDDFAAFRAAVLSWL
jgi:uncharacterized protein YutE (UPF0331/DUF86 family)